MSASGDLELTSYSVSVGSAVVTIDFQAGALDIDFAPGIKSARTAELVSGTVLADYDSNGNLLAVEVLCGVPPFGEPQP